MRIALTRPRGRGVEFARELCAAGHEVIEVPLTEIRSAEPYPDPLDFDGVLFTSVSAVERAPESNAWPRVGAVGEATARALQERGIRVDVVGEGGGAELARAWGDARGQKLLLPQAREAHPALAEGLVGAEVTCVAVYETVAREDVDRAALETSDLVCFFAPSAVRAYLTLEPGSRPLFWGHGPTTRAAMAEAGLVSIDNPPWQVA